MFVEFPKTIKKEYNFLQGIEKLQDKFTNIKSLTDNALQNIERAKEKIEHLKQSKLFIFDLYILLKLKVYLQMKKNWMSKSKLFKN